MGQAHPSGPREPEPVLEDDVVRLGKFAQMVRCVGHRDLPGLARSFVPDMANYHVSRSAFVFLYQTRMAAAAAVLDTAERMRIERAMRQVELEFETAMRSGATRAAA